jgi:hypothetical protein
MMIEETGEEKYLTEKVTSNVNWNVGAENIIKNNLIIVLKFLNFLLHFFDIRFQCKQ